MQTQIYFWQFNNYKYVCSLFEGNLAIYKLPGMTYGFFPAVHRYNNDVAIQNIPIVIASFVDDWGSLGH